MFCRIVACIFAFAAMTSCLREPEFEEIGNDDAFAITFSSREMGKVVATRALAGQTENMIFSLYLFIVKDDDIISKKYVRLDTPADSYTCKLDRRAEGCDYIYAVANADFEENALNSAELKSQMDEVLTVSALRSLFASYSENAENISRPQGHLLMCGLLEKPTLNPDNRTLWLRHIDASVKFRVETHPDAVDAGADFSMTGWQVFRVPRKTYLFDRRYDNVGNKMGEYHVDSYVEKPSDEEYNSCPWDITDPDDGNDYFDSEFSDVFSTGTQEINGKKQRISQFDFYMFENRKLAKMTTGENYSLREHRVSPSDRTFDYAPDDGTYVVIRGVFRQEGMDLGKTGDALGEYNAGAGDKITVPDEVSRYAEVEYTIHLGHFDKTGTDRDGSTDNFFTDRNTRYTYIVRVKNAHDIAVEAIIDQENTPGAERDVKDSWKNTFGDFDAHFGNMLIGIEVPRHSDGSLDMSYFTDPEKCMQVICPYMPSGKDDFSWLQFAPMEVNGDEGSAEKIYSGGYTYFQPAKRLTYSYCRSKSRLVAMSMLPDWIYDRFSYDTGYLYGSLGLAEGTNAGNNTLWFTVFVDEYYPQRDINGVSSRAEEYRSSSEGPWGESLFWPGYGPNDTPDIPALSGRGTGTDPENIPWQSYIDVANREFRLFNDNFESGDRHSTYSLSRVYITQKSMQSYYDMGQMESSSKALGVEHTDEVGLIKVKNRGTYPGFIDNPLNGFLASCAWFMAVSTSYWPCLGQAGTCDYGVQGNDWSTYVEAEDYDSTEKQFVSPGCTGDDYRNKVYGYPELVFLQRNRDLNGDGKITIDEIRWYTPGIDHMRAISQNGVGLRNPLYDTTLEHTGALYSDPRDNHIYWYYTSTADILWSDEVTSGGDIDNEYRAYHRCVRNIGGNAYPDYKNNPDWLAHPDWIVRDSPDLTVPDKVYEWNEGSLDITPKGLKANLMRRPVRYGELVPMSQFSSMNTIASTGFRVADRTVAGYSAEPKMCDLDKGISPCSDYYENPDGSDVGRWRVPNAQELTIMNIAGIVKDYRSYSISGGWEDVPSYLVSCTKYHWAYATDATGLDMQMEPTWHEEYYDKEWNYDKRYLNEQNGSSYYTWHAMNNHHYLTFKADHIRLNYSNYWQGMLLEYDGGWTGHTGEYIQNKTRCVRDL